MPSNSDWLYEQCRRDNALDEGVHLTFAHAMQIAGELKEQGSKLEAIRKYCEFVDQQGVDPTARTVAQAVLNEMELK